MNVNCKPELTGANIVDLLSPSRITIRFTSFPVSGLEKLELEMEKAWERSAGFSETMMPQPSMFVGVKDQNGKCKRGFVETVVGKLVEVFLCDDGVFVTVDDLRRLAQLDDEFQHRLCFWGRIVTIPGIVPARVLKFRNTEKVVPSNAWSRDTSCIVKDWFSGSKVAVSIFSHISPVSTFGDFYKEGSKDSLSSFLCQHKHCIVDSAKFKSDSMTFL